MPTFTGSADRDMLFGTDRADTMHGLGGGDELYGSAGADRMWGGAGEDQLSAQQLIKLKRINEELVTKISQLEATPEYRDALEVLKKTEQDVIPRVERPADREELEELCRQVRLAMGSGDARKMEEATAVLNDRLLNYAYLL